VQLRWPLLKQTGRGATHVIEPMVQLAWSGGDALNIPNDESTLVEFDEGNLLSLSRFPEPDRREYGFSAAYGLSWSRIDPGGWETNMVMGQVLRDERLVEFNGTSSFSNVSGLQNHTSDFLFASQIKTPNGLTLTARGLFDEGYATTKAAARASWQNENADIGATYIWLRRDLAENRDNTISEWAVDGSYRLSRHWTGSANWRYDVASDRNVTAGIGLTYTNECVEAKFSASRRFTSSTILEPSTNFALTVALRGFSAKTSDKSYTRTCRN
jgi:LPS-assembly protein